MDYQKDNQNPSLDSQSKPISIDLNFSGILKKTEKIISAIYMVSDLFDDREPLKTRLRESALQMVGMLHELPFKKPVEKHVLFDLVKASIGETLSYIDIGKTILSISEMNASILERELSKLSAIMEEYQARNQRGNFQSKLFGEKHVDGLTLSEALFDHKDVLIPGIEKEASTGDRNYKGQDNVGNVLYKNSFKSIGQNNRSADLKSTFKNVSPKNDAALKINRRNNILRLIKDKKIVMIKDISLIITDCSEKTIQRELNTLVSEGVLKRAGKKRWSKYSLA